MQVFLYLDRFRDDCCHDDVFYLVYICRRVRESGSPFFITKFKTNYYGTVKESTDK